MSKSMQPSGGGKPLTIKASDMVTVVWNGTQSATASASYTTAKKCNFMILSMVNGIAGGNNIAYYISRASCTASAGEVIGQAMSGRTNEITQGIAEAGETLTGTATAGTLGSTAYGYVFIMTDE